MGYLELLAPAGGPEPFRAALAAGADAIYCGVGNDFNARRGADNFTFDTFEAACREAHLAGARVYVTINIVIKTDEMNRALALVYQTARRGADAFIVQDWGLLSEIHTRWPELELHVSTQANIHDTRGVIWCREHSAQRVTLSRELSIDEIAAISRVGVDLEVFGHGALCFCYSGVCQLSSTTGRRSANRGLCAQPCRLPYELVDETGKLLSAVGRTRPLCPKDACTATDIDALMAAGVHALKIEGRMKAPDYVWNVVSAYREQIPQNRDMAEVASVSASISASASVLSSAPESSSASASLPTARQRRLAASTGSGHTSFNEAFHAPKLGSTPLSRAVQHRLKRVFNRDFTDAYLHGTSNDDMMSYERSNNRGELVGTVVSSSGGTQQRRDGKGALHKNPRQNRHAVTCLVTIHLDESVGEGDLLELRPQTQADAFLTTTAPRDAVAGETIVCHVARQMPVDCPVRLIRSKAAHDQAHEAISRERVCRRSVDVHITAYQGEPFSVQLVCVDRPRDKQGHLIQATAHGFIVEPARTRSVSVDDLIEHVGRMGTSAFAPRHIDVDLDANCGMGFSAVHAVRAHACELLEQAILAPWVERAEHLARPPKRGHTSVRVSRQSTAPTLAPEVCALVASPEAARRAQEAGTTRLYASSDAMEYGTWPAECIVVLDEICRESDHARLDSYICPQQSVAVGNISELAYAAQLGARPEIRSCIPVHNTSCLTALERSGAAGVWLSGELTLEEIAQLAPAAHVPVGLVVSGRPRAMTSEHCVLQTANACIHNCSKCTLRQQTLYLRNKEGDLLPVQTDPHGRSRIYGATPLDITPQIAELLDAGISRFAVDASLLNEDETAASVSRLHRALAAALQGRTPPERKVHTTTGHLFVGID